MTTVEAFMAEAMHDASMRAIEQSPAFRAKLAAHDTAEAARARRQGEGRHAPTIPDDFWSARPKHVAIRRAAQSRLIAPDALIGAVLARVVVHTDWRLVLPAVVGSVGSINSITTIVGSSGAGKGSAMSEAEQLVDVGPVSPDHVVGTGSAGSGEGIVHAFFATETDPKTHRKVKALVRRGMLIRVDEIGSLTAMAQRTGQTTMTTLRSAWSGERLGGSYASEEKNLHLDPHGYRIAVVMGAQPETTADLLADTAGGTPQRVLWLSAIDPNAPAVAPAHPGRIGVTLPTYSAECLSGRLVSVSAGDYRAHLAMSVAGTIEAEMRAERRTNLMGEADGDYDAHRALLRLKVAAALALLDDRVDVGPEDWCLAAMVVETSTGVRRWTQRQIEEARQARIDESTAIASTRAVAVSVARASGPATIDRIARSIFAKTDGTRTTAEIRRSLAGRDRSLFEDALAHASASGWIREWGDKLVKGTTKPGMK